MHFTKMEGLGNDFVLVDGSVEITGPLVRQVTDRHRGIGADGLLQVSLEDGLLRMGYWNADGSPAEMCGNGLRCVARFAYDRGLVETTTFEVATPGGLRRVTVGEEPTVEIGPVEVGESFVFEGWTFQRVRVGNPHAVSFVSNLSNVPVADLGSELSRLTEGGTNVEFVRVIDRHKLEMRVWERGVGETMACGSGMVAAGAAAFHLGFVDPEVTISVPGGDGVVDLDGTTSWLTGPVRYVFAGETLDAGVITASG